MYELVLTRELLERFWARVDTSSECWLWIGSRDEHGYGRISARCPDGRLWTISTHRLAWEFAHGAIPDELCVCHKCDRPPCVRYDHLWLGTHAENTADMIAKGRWPVAPEDTLHGPLPAKPARVCLKAGGVTLSVREWADLKGIPARTLRSRIRSGWSDEKVVSEPYRDPAVLKMERRARLTERFGLQFDD